MELLNENKKVIYEEIKFVINILKESENVDECIYYLSAIHPMIKRVFNIKFNKHLVFMYFILNNSFRSVTNVVSITKQGRQPIIINIDFFHKFAKLLEELAETIKEDKFPYEILEKIVLLTYSINGNGFYLQQKGIKLIDF